MQALDCENKNSLPRWQVGKTKNEEMREKWRKLNVLFWIVSAITAVLYLRNHESIILDERQDAKPSVDVDQGERQGANYPEDVVRAQVNKSQVFQTRREILNGFCGNNTTVGKHINDVTGSKDLNIAVCVVQKAGCTQWIRLFKYLAGQKRNRDSPLAISKYEVHYKDKKLIKSFNIFGKDKAFVSNALRVMTVRNPFARLWSAYVDKFVLPDFWLSKGKEIVATSRKHLTPSARRCGNDVTFAEFVEYVTRVGHSTKSIGQDMHWLPASDLCDPCVFKPDIIQKQETLVPDFNFTMNAIGLGKLFSKMFSVSAIDFEIQDEIDYVFSIQKKMNKCLPMSHLLETIWRGFVLNGYLPPEVIVPKVDPSDVTKDKTLEIIRETRAKYNMTSAKTKLYRNTSRTLAYMSLSDIQKAKLKELYKLDMMLFDYNDSILNENPWGEI